MNASKERRRYFNIAVILVLLFSHEVHSFSIFGQQTQQMINVESTYDYFFLAAHSFRSPFYLVRGGLPYWQFGGSTVISDEYVRLTPAEKSMTGWIWNQRYVIVDEWEAEMQYKIWSTSSMGADGLAFWYISEPLLKEGQVFGGPASWTGLGVFFDTFDNNNDGDTPKVAVYYNDGSWEYNIANDGKGQELGSCRLLYRNYEGNVKIQYFQGQLQVLLKTPGIRNDYELCTRVSVKLPTNYFLGLTAATGGVTDNHDILGFSFKKLNMKYELEQKRPNEPQQQQPNRPRQQQPQQQPDDRADTISEKLRKLKEQQPPQQQQQQQQPHVQQAPVELSGNALNDLQSLQQQQVTLDTALRSTQKQLTDISNIANKNADLLDQINERQAVFAEALEQLVKSSTCSTSGEGSQVSPQLEAFYEELNAVRQAVQNRISTNDNFVRNLQEISRMVGELKTKVDETKQGQAQLGQNIKNTAEVLGNTIESSSTYGFWTYFLLIQVMFGVAVLWWRKYSAERDKKLF